jgi:hypothetical protein
MTRYVFVGVVCLAGVVAGANVVAHADQAQAAAAAIKASPDLVNGLAKEIGGTPEQAAGAAGALFGLAKSRLTLDQFSQVSKAVPGMDALLAAAPGGATGFAKMAGGVGGLGAATQAFGKLGLSPDMVSKAVPFLTSMVSKSGGAGVGSLLAGVLK